MDLEKHQSQANANNPSPKESFLEILFIPSINSFEPHFPLSVENTNQNNSPMLKNEDCNPSSADTIIRERCPSSECEVLKDFSQSEANKHRPWEPCDACRPNVQVIMEEKRRMKDMLSSITSIQQSPTAELYPNSGLFLSSTRLAAIQQEAKKDCLHLFHLLFDKFFTPEECINCVAFGKHGKVPEGKKKLDESKVKGILTFVMSCAKLHGWEPVEKAKLKKAIINKCRTRAKFKTL
ncbi:hypothetical protein NFI96_010760 [Prochilodus magdalenae]|nr:hypothetical protein NFI96_010760 [Prochilodus magdalenae]